MVKIDMFLPKKTNWKQTLPTSFLAAANAGGTAPIGQHSRISSARRSFVRSAAQRSPLAVASFAAAAANSRRSALPVRSLLGRNFTAGALGRSLMNFSFNRHNDTVDSLMSSATRLHPAVAALSPRTYGWRRPPFSIWPGRSSPDATKPGACRPAPSHPGH